MIQPKWWPNKMYVLDVIDPPPPPRSKICIARAFGTCPSSFCLLKWCMLQGGLCWGHRLFIVVFLGVKWTRSCPVAPTRPKSVCSGRITIWNRSTVHTEGQVQCLRLMESLPAVIKRIILIKSRWDTDGWSNASLKNINSVKCSYDVCRIKRLRI